MTERPDSECSTTDGELCVTSVRDGLTDEVPESMLCVGSQSLCSLQASCPLSQTGELSSDVGLPILPFV